MDSGGTGPEESAASAPAASRNPRRPARRELPGMTGYGFPIVTLRRLTVREPASVAAVAFSR
jgi:hypothetical protein